MVQRLTILTFLVAVTGLCAGCPSSTLPGGPRLTTCAPNFDPIEVPTLAQLQLNPATAHEQAPVQLTDESKIYLPQGDYGFMSASIFYYDTANDIHLSISEAADPNIPGQWDIGLFCLSGNGINPKLAPISENIPFVSDLKVLGGGAFQIRDRSALFALGQPANPSLPWLTAPTDPSPGTPDQIYHSGSPLKLFKASEFTLVAQYLLDINTVAPALVTTGNYAIQTYLRKSATATDDTKGPGPGRPSGQLPGAGKPMWSSCPDNTVCVNIQVNLALLTDDQRALRDKQAATLLAQQQGTGPKPAPVAAPKKR